MNALSLMDADLKALMNVKTVMLVNIPLLKKLTLRAAFTNAEEGIVENAGEFEKRKELKGLKGFEEWEKRVVVSSSKEWESLEWHVGEIVVGNGCCNKCVMELDFKRFGLLKRIEIGDECFENANEVKLIGLSQLEKVVIGKKCFTEDGYDPDVDFDAMNPNRHFYLKNCERLRELKIDCDSFADYSVCEIENVPSLEVIEMGELNEWSNNFLYASLELKSDSERME